MIIIITMRYYESGKSIMMAVCYESGESMMMSLIIMKISLFASNKMRLDGSRVRSRAGSLDHRPCDHGVTIKNFFLMFIFFVWLTICVFVKDSYAYFHIVCIISGISIAFFLLIRLWVVVSKISTISKLMRGFKLFEAKIGNNLVKAELLLFVANFAIGNLSAQSSCW